MQTKLPARSYPSRGGWFRRDGLQWAAVLSLRERDVALLVACGLSNKEVARKLGLSEGTVKGYLHGIFGKLDIRSRRGLMLLHLTPVRRASQRQVVSPLSD